MGGDERLLVLVAAAHREHPAVGDDEGDGGVGAEQLRLAHEPDPAPQVDGREEVVPVREVIRGEDHGAGPGDVLGPDRPGAVDEQGGGREHDPRQVIDTVGFAGASPLVEPREVLGGAGVLVDLGLDLGHGR